jgi:hypothetical protein
MPAASSLLKPFASLQIASLDAVAIAIAETNVELSSEHALFRSSEIPAKGVASIFFHAEPLMEAVSEIVLRLGIAGCCRDSEPLHCHAPRSRNSKAVSIPRARLYCATSWLARPPGDTRTLLALDFVGSR